MALVVPCVRMQFLRPENEHKELTYSDVFLMPQYSDIHSRMDVDLTPVDGIGTTIPIVVANMTAVAGRRMAETVARRGGLVILPQDMSFERISEIVSYVKQAHHVIETPVVLDETESVQTALNLIHKRAHKAVIITDTQNHPVGIFTEKDAWRRDRYSPLRDVMTRNLITISDVSDPKVVYKTLSDRRLNIMPVTGGQGELLGVVTRKSMVRTSLYDPATNAQNQLLTCAAVRIREGLEENIKKLMEIGVDVFVLDTAHGHQERMIDAIKRARAILGPDRHLVAGNIVTTEAAQAYIEAGASILKVGVGPGAACKTRMMTGVGRPQFSAVQRVSTYARKFGVHVWADGGCKHPRDVALAIAAGASSAMIGTWFAGTHESPADIKHDEKGDIYKEQFGMASSRAVVNRSRECSAFDLARRAFFEEGVSQSRMYLRPGQEGVEDILDQITAGLRSACTYSGARSLNEFHEKALVGVQTGSGYSEGKPVKKSW
jgi:IMP dehydrogenase